MTTLVLSRKVGDRINIGHNVEVVILKTTRGQCRIAIHAPKGIRIMRAEIDECDRLRESEAVE